MEPRIEILPEKKLVGKHATMSVTANTTSALWQSFMANKKEIKNIRSTDLFSLQIYDRYYDFKNLNPNATFEKWAAAEVTDFSEVPNTMESLILKEGLYAIFIHTGAATTGQKTFQYIFGSWLPASGYELDHRPHFELLGEKYKNNDPTSEEEIWVPIRKKRD